ncbi:MAG: GFA family protein [Pseudomonadota bacterium]
MADDTIYEGGCLCGAVRFKSRGEPNRVGVCHCLDCRKHHGAPFYAAAIFAVEQVTFDGETRSHPDHEDRAFCPKCGSSVFAVTGSEVELHLGSYDETGIFTPQYELWTKRREPWLQPIAGARQFSENYVKSAAETK